MIDAHDKQKYNFITLPVKDIWGLLMLKNSPLADKEYITSSDILNIPLICSGQTMVSNKIAGWLNQKFTQLNIVANYNLIYNASIMVQENLGSALCLANLVNTNGTNLCFKPLYPPLEAQIDLVWKNIKYSLNQLNYFYKIFKNIYFTINNTLLFPHFKILMIMSVIENL